MKIKMEKKTKFYKTYLSCKIIQTFRPPSNFFFFQTIYHPSYPPLRIHDQFVALSTALVTFSWAFLFNAPEMTMLVKALLIDIALNPRPPTSTALHVACQPFTRHCSSGGSYLAIFLSCVDSLFLWDPKFKIF